MQWEIDATTASAGSALHDDGSPLSYTFTRTPEGWRNDSDAELLVGPHLLMFKSLGAAKAWAEGAESRLQDAP